MKSAKLFTNNFIESAVNKDQYLDELKKTSPFIQRIF
jgi:hypothetical protein